MTVSIGIFGVNNYFMVYVWPWRSLAFPIESPPNWLSEIKRISGGNPKIGRDQRLAAFALIICLLSTPVQTRLNHTKRESIKIEWPTDFFGTKSYKVLWKRALSAQPKTSLLWPNPEKLSWRPKTTYAMENVLSGVSKERVTHSLRYSDTILIRNRNQPVQFTVDMAFLETENVFNQVQSDEGISISMVMGTLGIYILFRCRRLDRIIQPDFEWVSSFPKNAIEEEREKQIRNENISMSWGSHKSPCVSSDAWVGWSIRERDTQRKWRDSWSYVLMAVLLSDKQNTNLDQPKLNVN